MRIKEAITCKITFFKDVVQIQNEVKCNASPTIDLIGITQSLGFVASVEE